MPVNDLSDILYEFSKPKTKTPGYDCVGNGDVCESQRFCCGELICSLGKDERKRCIDASDEINKYGLGGLVTTSSIDKDGDISYLKSSSSPVPGPMEILAKERAKLKVSTEIMCIRKELENLNQMRSDLHR